MQRWNPPLPEGWTARWDPGQNRYFFINHSTKTTQWIDPRVTAAPPQRPQQPQTQSYQAQPRVNPYAAASSLSPSRGQQRASSRSPSPGQAYQMQDMSSRASSNQGHGRQGRQQTSNQNEETSMSADVDQGLVNHLHQEFPNTTKALIADILLGCYNNEREAREQLNDLGFAIKSDERATSAHSSSHRGRPQQQQQQAAAPKELSQVEKNRMHQQMLVAFPGVTMEVVEMTMKVVKYDPAKGKVLLERFLDNQKKSTSTSAASTTSTRGGTATSSVARAVSPARNEPASLTANADNQPQGMSSGSGQIPTSSVARMLTGSGGTTRTSSTAPSTSSGTGRHQPTQYSNAKQVTNKNRKNVPPKKTVIVVSQPRPKPAPTSDVMSSQASSALGPDPGLRRGPDASLLSTDLGYADGPDLSLRNGPDKELRFGPDRSRACGPIGALGPDMSLRCGPQASLLGINNDHANILITDI